MSDDASMMLERQTRVLEQIASAAPLPEVLTTILRSLEELMPGAACSVLLLDRERGTLHHGAAPSLPADYTAIIDGMSIGESAGSCGTAAALNTPVIATDLHTDPRWTDFRHAAILSGMRSCWSTPIEGRDGLPVGTFAVYFARSHRPTGREQLLVDRFTHLTSVAIDHAGLLGDLVESEERFRRSFDDNSLGMAILGLDGTITTSNTALVSLARRDPVGDALADLVTPQVGDLPSRFEQVGRCDDGPVSLEAVLHAGGDAGIEVDVTISLLRDRDGSPAQYVVNVYDLTERRAAEQDRRARLEAETARRTAEELSHAKSELLAAVGHEARTPIQAIVGFAELLGTIDLDETRRREALDHIGAAAGHVMELLADVLDLSRIEAGALPLVLDTVCVREVVDEAFGLLSADARQRRTHLSCELGDEGAHADRRRLRQVLLNLVGNAIRHGHEGGQVVVRAHTSDGDPATLLVSVEDDGPGIPLDLLPGIFHPFAVGRADDAERESVGLGLSLAHGLVSAMGGDLHVAESTAGGTALVLRIPRARTDPHPTEPRPREIPPKEGHDR